MAKAYTIKVWLAKGDEEKMVEMTLPDQSFSAVIAERRKFYPGWRFSESK